MLQRGIYQIKVYTFHQQVGGDQHLLAWNSNTAASSPTPYFVSGFCNLISWVRCLISPNSPSVEISVLFPSCIVFFYALLISSLIMVVIRGCASSAAFCTSSWDTSTILPSAQIGDDWYTEYLNAAMVGYNYFRYGWHTYASAPDVEHFIFRRSFRCWALGTEVYALLHLDAFFLSVSRAFAISSLE